MGRHKGSGNKVAQDTQESVHGTETSKMCVAPAIEPERAETAKTRCFRYSAALPQGRIFEIGEIIPAGWFDSPAKITG